MLVLSRKKAEQIQIGENITITVIKVKGAAVQIGIDAPSDVKILRSELAFDPPSASDTATVTATAAAAATKVPPATRNGQPIDRDQTFAEESRSPNAQRSAVEPRGDRVTLADTLVFLG